MLVGEESSVDDAPKSPPRPAGSTFWIWLRCWVSAAVPLIVVFGYIAVRNPRFFFLDDKQAQYAATYHYIGQELLGGHLPVLVPWQGTSANLLLDAQYGLMNPIYWVQNIAFSQFSDLALASLLMAAAYLLVLQGGAAAWLLRLGAKPAWAVVGAFAASAGGYAIWWVGPSWHPGLASLAFVPWLGWALAAHRSSVGNALAIVVATFATVGGGWPFTVVTAVVLVVLSLAELLQRRAIRQAVTQAVAAAGGALLAAPTLLFAASALTWTIRAGSASNDAFLVPGTADVLNSGMATAASNMPAFTGPVVVVPIMLAGGLAVTLLPLVDLPRRWWQTRGAVTVVLAAAATLVLTQLPSVLGPMRWPFRFLGAWQVLLAVAIAGAFGVFGVRITRERALVSGALLAVFAFVTVARTPTELKFHAVSVAVAIAGLLAILLLRDVWRPVGLLLTCVAAVLWAVTARPANTDMPDWQVPAQTAAYQNPLGTQPQRSLVLYPQGTDYRSAAAQGVYIGQNYLLGPARAGLGYTPVGQRYLFSLMDTEEHGWTRPPGIAFLLSTEPQTGRQWVDLLGANVITAHRQFVPQLTAGLPEQWRQTDSSPDFVVLSRNPDPRLSGRITYLPPGVGAQPVTVGATEQVYDVTATQPARIVFADVYWPGYSATWNGQPIAVTPLAESLVSVQVPAGQGQLAVAYRPAGTGLAAGSAVLGLLLTVGGVVLSRRRSEGVTPDPTPAPVTA